MSTNSPALLKFFNSNLTNPDPLKSFIRIFKINKTDIKGNLDDISSYIYLDSRGNLIIKNDYNSSSSSPYQIFKNPLSSDEKIETSLVTTSKPRRVNSLFINKKNFLYSNNMKWILFTGTEVGTDDKNCIHILYNPFYREEFKKYYLKNQGDANKYYSEYCKMVGNDPYENCIDSAKCKKDFLGETAKLVESLDNAAYKQLDTACRCFNRSCTQYQSNLAEADSFLHNYFIVGNGTAVCQNNITIAICNANISAGGNASNLQTTIQQNCKATSNIGNIDMPKPTSKPTTDPATDPATDPVADPETDPATGSTTEIIIKSTSTSTSRISKLKSYIVSNGKTITIVTIILILIILVILLIIYY